MIATMYGHVALQCIRERNRVMGDVAWSG